jgi:hypothetical protein
MVWGLAVGSELSKALPKAEFPIVVNLVLNLKSSSLNKPSH